MGFRINDGVLERYTDDDNCKDVIIPDGVKKIDAVAFCNCNYMTDLTIPNGLTYISGCAFRNCNRLENIVFPSNPVEIEADALEDTKWWKDQIGNDVIIAAGTLLKYDKKETDPVIPDGVVYIAKRVFKGHTEIESITFPSSLRKIGYEAFSGCTGLRSVAVPFGVTGVSGSFEGCTGLVSAKLPEGITEMSGTFSDCVNLKEVNIPSTVKIMSHTFINCRLIDKAELPDSLEKMKRVFTDTKVTILNVPPNVREIEDLYADEQLEAINVDNNNPTFSSVDGVLYSKDKKWLYTYPSSKRDEEFVVPQSVEHISDKAFYQTKYLKKVVLHNNIDYVKKNEYGTSWYNPFFGCISIEHLEGYPEFRLERNGYSLPKVYYEKHSDEIVETILYGKKEERERASRYEGVEEKIAVHALEKLSDGKYTKKNLSNLSEYFDINRKQISAKTFAKLYELLKANKAESSLAVIPYLSIIKLKEEQCDPDVKLIKEFMNNVPAASDKKFNTDKCFKVDGKGVLVGFVNSASMTEIRLPSTVKEIRYIFSEHQGYGYYARKQKKPDCSGITKLSIPKETEIIESLDLLSDLEEIDVDSENEHFLSANGLLFKTEKNKVSLFFIPPALKRICIPKNCNDIKGADLSQLEEISFEQGNKSFSYVDGYLIRKTSKGKDLVYVSPDIVDITVPDGVKYFSLSNCYNSEKIRSIEMPDSVIDASGLNNCRSLKHVKLSGSIKKISDFENCESLEEVEIPEGVEEISRYGFVGCSALKRVVLPSTLKKIGSNAFYNCSSLCDLTIPDGVEVAGDAFPSNCKVNNGEFEYGIKYSGNTPVEFDENKHDFVFKSGVYEIPKGFFKYTRSQFFHDIRHFDSVYISDTVVKLDAQQLSNFAQITVDEKNSEFSSADGVLFDKEKTVLLRFPVFKRCDEYVIPDTVKRIEDSAFEWCRRIKSVVIPEGVTYIGESAFALCDELTQIKVPFTATEIGSAAFVTEDNCNKAQRRDVTLSFYKNDSIVPLKLKRNWNVFTEEKKLSQFICDPKHHEKYLSEFKDADYKLAAAMIMYFLFDEKGFAEKTVRANIEQVIDLAAEANSTGVIKRLLGDNMLTDSQKNECMKKMNNHMD